MDKCAGTMPIAQPKPRAACQTLSTESQILVSILQEVDLQRNFNMPTWTSDERFLLWLSPIPNEEGLEESDLEFRFDACFVITISPNAWEIV
jgi:hypothetical protein